MRVALAALGLLGALTRTATPTSREQVIQPKHNATLHDAFAPYVPLENATYYPYAAELSKAASVESHPYVEPKYSYHFRKDVGGISLMSDDPFFDQFRNKDGTINNEKLITYLKEKTRSIHE